jgi:hypothetical protein
LANYSFPNNDLSITSASMPDQFTVDLFLATAPLPGSNYVLQISGALSLAGTPIAPATRVTFSVPTNYPAFANLIAAFGPAGISNSPIDGVTWADLSGNGNDAINPSSTVNNRPTRVVKGLNGYDTLAFDSSLFQTLYIDGPTSVGLDQQDYTWYVVVQVTNMVASLTPNIIRHQASPGGTTALNANWGSFFTAGTLYAANRDPGGTAISAVASPVNNGQWYIISGHVDVSGPTSRAYDPASYSAVEATTPSSAVFATPPLATWIGSTPAGVGWFGGQMAEVLLYTGPLADTDKTNIEAYLTAKYFPVVPVLSVTRAGADIRVEFTGVLQSATNATGTYVDLPGNPASPYVITPGSQLSRQFFRARGQ